MSQPGEFVPNASKVKGVKKSDGYDTSSEGPAVVWEFQPKAGSLKDSARVPAPTVQNVGTAPAADDKPAPLPKLEFSKSAVPVQAPTPVKSGLAVQIKKLTDNPQGGTSEPAAVNKP